MLTLRTLGISGSGPVIGSEPYRYEVVGLPTGRGAMLARLSGVWKILNIEPGKNYAWTGSFLSADDALTSLEGDGGTSNGDSARRSLTSHRDSVALAQANGLRRKPRNRCGTKTTERS